MSKSYMTCHLFYFITWPWVNLYKQMHHFFQKTHPLEEDLSSKIAKQVKTCPL